MKSIRIGCLCALAAGLVWGQAPVINSVVDPYTGSTKLAPGGLAVITGTTLAGGGLVTVGGVNAFTLVPPTLVPGGGPTETIEIPVNAPLGSSVPVIVTTGVGGPSAPFNITLTQFAPVLISATSGALTSPRHGNGVGITAATPAAPGEIHHVLCDRVRPHESGSEYRPIGRQCNHGHHDHSDGYLRSKLPGERDGIEAGKRARIFRRQRTQRSRREARKP